LGGVRVAGFDGWAVGGGVLSVELPANKKPWPADKVER
jgi:hypothetical protein